MNCAAIQASSVRIAEKLPLLTASVRMASNAGVAGKADARSWIVLGI